MKIVLFGATDITLKIADFLCEKGYRPEAVVTAPQTFKISYKKDGVVNSRHADMHSWAHEKSIPVFNYETADIAVEVLTPLSPDFALVAGWYYMIPQKVRDIFPKGCAGFHASLLPEFRGGAPLNWSILLNKKETGVSFFELTGGVDDGFLLDQKKIIIEQNDYIGDLIEKSTQAMLDMLATALPKIEKETLKRYKQRGTASYCGQRIPEDSAIQWGDTADNILRLIRASSRPYAGAYSFLEGHKISFWAAEISSIKMYGAPGQIMNIDGDVHIVCGQGALRMTDIEADLSLHKANHKRLSSHHD